MHGTLSNAREEISARGEFVLKQHQYLRTILSAHYNKCRETKESTLSLLRQGRRQVCWCANVRESMKKLKEEKFPDSPMPLQLLSAIAIPKENGLKPTYPYCEEVLCLRISAVRIQRKWRSFLQARGGNYRTRLCKFYPHSCRKGVDCVFAHGRHDLRKSFYSASPVSSSDDTSEPALRVSLSNLIQFI